MTIGVIVATYRRPVDLARCLEALAPQMRKGDQVIVVTRPSDRESLDVLDGLAMPVTRAAVEEAGVVAAENAGLRRCGTELAAFIDDDGVAPPDWLARIRGHFEVRADLGALCGPVLPVVRGKVRRERAHRWGRILWHGRHTGETDRLPDAITECDIVRGCNMAFRRSLLPEFDRHLKGPLRFEDAAALAVKRLGYRVVCDPALAVAHWLSPVSVEVSRSVTPREAFGLNHNNTYVLGRHFSGARLAAFLLYTFLFGDRQALGAARLLWRWLRRRDSESARFAVASLAGKIEGVRTLCGSRS